MRIIIGMSHPKHFWMFKDFIQTSLNKGWEIKILVSNKEVLKELLDSYGFEYLLLGSNKSTFFKKILQLPIYFIKTLKVSISFKPHIFIGQALLHFAFVSFLLGKKYFIFEDTDHVKTLHKIILPFCTKIVTPNNFDNSFSGKHVLFDGIYELAYLHPRIYKPNRFSLCELNINSNEQYCIIRFVSWEAHHDYGLPKLEEKNKIQLCKLMAKHMHVFVSSEGEIPDQIKEFKINISPNNMHDILSYASLYIGEGATMAAEAALMGVPSIYINTLSTSFCNKLSYYKLLYQFKYMSNEVIDLALSIIKNNENKDMWALRRNQFLEDTIDVSHFISWFIEEYPQSYKILKENPDYQNRFK